MRPQLLALAAAAAGGAAGFAPPAPAKQQQQPNLVWIVADDMEPSGFQVMPAAQRELLRGGTSFDRAHVASPKCCPSRTSALSGRFPHNMNAENLGWCGNFATVWANNTFVRALHDAGYTTGHVGKLFNDEPR